MDKPLFFVVRHGKTEGNELGIYRGHSNERYAQLSQEGRQDIREAAMFLKGLGQEFSVVLADDLSRAKESARILMAVLGIKEVVFIPKLRPLDVGDYTGKPKDEHPVEEFYRDKSRRIPGGETVGGFDVRMAEVFDLVMEVSEKTGKPALVIGHGSTISFLYNVVNAKGGNVGYEGLVEPGGVLSFSARGLAPLLKEKKESSNTGLVKLERWAVDFVGDSETGGRPKSCFNCHMLWSRQETCAIIGPGIVIRRLERDGKRYTPVCGLHDAGKPMDAAKASYPAAVLGPEKADAIGLEWAEGEGTNCGGAAEGAPCKWFSPAPGEKGFCAVIREANAENRVDSADCCSAHNGPSMPWRDAQELIGKQDGDAH